MNLFSAKEAIAQAVTCPPDDFAFTFNLSDGTVWVTQVYAVIDEIEFEDASSSSSSSSSSDDSPDSKVSAVDLTGTDDNVPDSVPLDVPTGRSYNEVKFKIKRLEDNPAEQPVNVNDLAAFLTRIGFNGNNLVRPSVYIEGFMALGTPGSFTNCTSFKFVTDRRSSVRVPFATGTFDIDSEEAVLQIDIEAAFSGALINVLISEVGKDSPDKPLGPGFLDGRLKDPSKFGTQAARTVADKLATSVEVFTMPKGTFSSSGSRIDDSKDDNISGDDPTRTDDNPSASDLDAPPV